MGRDFRIYAREFPFLLLEIWNALYYFAAVLLDLTSEEKTIDIKNKLVILLDI